MVVGGGGCGGWQWRFRKQGFRGFEVQRLRKDGNLDPFRGMKRADNVLGRYVNGRRLLVWTIEVDE